MRHLRPKCLCIIILLGSVQAWTQAGTITSLSNYVDHDRPSNATVGGSSDEDCSKHVMLAASTSSEASVEARNETIKRIPRGALKIAVDSNLGILITGWEGQDTKVKICMLSSAQDSLQAGEVLAQTQIMIRPGLVEVTAPHSSHGSFAGVVLVSVPNGIKVDSSAVSGGIAIEDVQAEVSATTVNGGIRVHNAAGLIKGESTNGGIYVDLSNHWIGGGLELHSENGGATVELGSAFNGPLQISTDANTPFTCVAKACAEGRRIWGEKKILALGSDPTNVRVSTVHGGITVKNLRPSGE